MVKKFINIIKGWYFSTFNKNEELARKINILFKAKREKKRLLC